MKMMMMIIDEYGIFEIMFFHSWFFCCFLQKWSIKTMSWMYLLDLRRTIYLNGTSVLKDLLNHSMMEDSSKLSWVSQITILICHLRWSLSLKCGIQIVNKTNKFINKLNERGDKIYQKNQANYSSKIWVFLRRLQIFKFIFSICLKKFILMELCVSLSYMLLE